MEFMEFKVLNQLNISNLSFYEIEAFVPNYDSPRTGTVTDGVLIEKRAWFHQITRPFIQQVLCAELTIYVSEGGLFMVNGSRFSIENGVIFNAGGVQKEWKQGKCFNALNKLEAYLASENPDPAVLIQNNVLLENVNQEFERVTLYEFVLTNSVNVTINDGCAYVAGDSLILTEGVNLTFEFNINARRFFFTFNFAGGEFTLSPIPAKAKPNIFTSFESLVNSFYLDLDEDDLPFPPPIYLYETAASEAEADIEEAVWRGLDKALSRPERIERFVLKIDVKTGTQTVMLKYDDGTRDYIEEDKYKLLKTLTYNDFCKII